MVRGLTIVLTFLAVTGSAAAQPVIPPNLITLNDNGAWSWFENERAIVDPVARKLILSTVADASGAGGASRNGNVEIVSYDYDTAAVQRFVLAPNFQADDHDSAALYRRPDGRYVAMYARHGSDNFSRWRISNAPGDITNFGPEQALNNGAGTTYSNLYNLAAENGGAGRLYNFARTVDIDPHLQVSNDQGQSFVAGGRLLNGPGRPYMNYTSNGVDRIWFIATDQHPRNFNNSIYAAYIQNGQLHRTDGTIVDGTLFDAHAVAPSTLTKVFQGDANNIAWNSDIHLDAQGLPYIAFSVRKGNTPLPGGQGGTDHRYYYARFDGTNWNVHPLAYAGSELYLAENDYTGLVALDPRNPNSLFISTNVNPITNEALISSTDGQRHWEIFRGTTADGGATWSWNAVTANSTVDNLRPFMPEGPGDMSALLWLRGTYTSYINYNLSVVGITGVPEPSTLVLTSLAALGLAAIRRGLRRGSAIPAGMNPAARSLR